MTTAKAEPMTSDRRAWVADRYRQAAFDLLLSARRLVSLAEEVNGTTVVVADPAHADITAAREAIADTVRIIICDLPTVRTKGGAARGRQRA